MKKQVRRTAHACAYANLEEVATVYREDKSGFYVHRASGQKTYWLKSYCSVVPHTPPKPMDGRKDDSGKLDMTLLDDMPRAMAAITEVMQWAITKKEPKPYDRASWLGVHADRYRAAILRHNRDACQQGSRAPYEAPRFERDKETKLLHLAHMACSAMMALENTLREIELEQEAKNAVPKD